MKVDQKVKITAIVSLVSLVILASAFTYAWYTNNQSVSVNNEDVSVIAGSHIQIRNGFASNTAYADSIEFDSASDTSYIDASSNGDKFYSPDGFDPSSLYYEVTDVRRENTGEYGYYLCFDIVVRTNQNVDLYLGENSYIRPKEFDKIYEYEQYCKSESEYDKRLNWAVNNFKRYNSNYGPISRDSIAGAARAAFYEVNNTWWGSITNEEEYIALRDKKLVYRLRSEDEIEEYYDSVYASYSYRPSSNSIRPDSARFVLCNDGDAYDSSRVYYKAASGGAYDPLANYNVLDLADQGIVRKYSNDYYVFTTAALNSGLFYFRKDADSSYVRASSEDKLLIRDDVIANDQFYRKVSYIPYTDSTISSQNYKNEYIKRTARVSGLDYYVSAYTHNYTSAEPYFSKHLTLKNVWAPNMNYQYTETLVGGIKQATFTTEGVPEDAYNYVDCSDVEDENLWQYGNDDVYKRFYREDYMSGRFTPTKTVTTKTGSVYSTTSDGLATADEVGNAPLLLSFDATSGYQEKELMIKVWIEGTDRESETAFDGGEIDYNFELLGVLRRDKQVIDADQIDYITNNDLTDEEKRTVDPPRLYTIELPDDRTYEYTYNGMEWFDYTPGDKLRVQDGYVQKYFVSTGVLVESEWKNMGDVKYTFPEDATRSDINSIYLRVKKDKSKPASDPIRLVCVD